MGNTISAVVGNSPRSHRTRREVENMLIRLVALSEVKATIHYHRVVKHAIDAEILPVESVVRKLHVAHSGVKQNVEAVRAAMEEHLGSYVAPEVLDGLTATIYETLNRLISSVSDKNSSEVMSYAVTVGKHGGIGRIDCYMFYYKFYSPHLDGILDNCLITSLIVSRCDHSKLCATDMPLLAAAAHSATLPGGSQEDTVARVQTIQQMLLRELEQPFRKDSGSA